MLEWLFNELWSVFKTYIDSTSKNIISKWQMRRKISVISKELKKTILDKFQNEIYFNDLDRFLCINKIISSFMENCTSTGIHQYRNIDSFIEEYTNRFINQNPHHFAYKNVIASTLQRIFLLTFNKLNEVNDENIRAVINNLKEYATTLENNLSSIQTKIDSIESKTDENTRKIISFIEENVLDGKLLNVELASSAITIPFTAPDMNIDSLCKRQKVISDIVKSLETSNWIHIIGSSWSGKTSLAVLLKNKMENSLWIDFSFGDPVNIIKAFETAFNRIDFYETNELVIIIDNLPEIDISSAFARLFVSTIKNLIQKRCKFISFGAHQITNAFSNATNIYFLQKDLPEFDKDDVVELMTILNVPKHLFSDKTREFILELVGRKPAAIIIILEYLRSNNWNIDTESFSKILTLDIEELSKQINNLVIETIKDEKARELLYRVSVVGYSINKSEIKKIAEIEPQINLVGEKLKLLNGFWITGDKQLSVNSVLKNVASENLSDITKEKIHSIRADAIMSKKILDQIDITRLLSHLINAKRIDEAGYTYITAMQSMCENKIEYNESFLFSKMWHEIQLPQNMSLYTKAGVRFYQIWYDALQNKENNYSISDLINISEKNADIRELMLAAGAILMTVNRKIAINLITHAKNQGLPDTMRFSEYVEINPIAATSALMVINMDKISDIIEWFTYIKLILTDEMISELETSEYKHIFMHIFEKTRMTISISETDKMLSVLQEIRYYAVEHSWSTLIIGCDISTLRIAGINKCDYTNSKSMFKKYMQETTNETYISNLKFSMGLLAIDNKDYDYAIKCLCDASSIVSGLDDTDKIICYTNCSVAFSMKKMDYESEAAINQALKLAETSLNIEEVLRKQFLTKIHFEKLICYYLHNNIAASLDSLDYVVDYLSKNTVEGNEHIIAIVSHNIVYILYDILKKNPPKKMGNEKYMAPYAGMLWNQSNNDAFKDGTSESRLTMISILTSQLFHHYGKKDESKKWLDYSLDRISKNLINDTLYSLLSLNGFVIYRLLEQKRYTLACNIYVDTLNHIADTVGINSIMIRYTLVRFSVFLVANENLFEDILAHLKQCTVSNILENIWKYWIEDLETFCHNQDTKYWVEKGNEYGSQPSCSHLHAMCYILATKNADLKELLSLYMSILPSIYDGLFADAYWMNYVFIPLIKKQFIKFSEGYSEYETIFERHLNLISEYVIDVKKIKAFFKGFVDLFASTEFKPEQIDWLNL